MAKAAPKEACPVCEAVLGIHCNELHNEQACEIREKYQNDRSMDSSDVSYQLAKIETPQQHEYVVSRLTELGFIRR